MVTLTKYLNENKPYRVLAIRHDDESYFSETNWNGIKKSLGKEQVHDVKSHGNLRKFTIKAWDEPIYVTIERISKKGVSKSGL
ncbi:MAG: hypothetical protein FWF27_00965 [Candidatus Bathyarchaeota archaeon]|nr:hypothetical protein [Candidatus Termiticorpusculum sp.]